MRRARRLLIVAVAGAVALSACGGGGSPKLAPPRATPSGNVMLGDDFAANGSGWTESDDPALKVHLLSGALVVESHKADATAIVPSKIGDDVFDAETAVELDAGNAGPGQLGVACRVTGDRWYSFTIDDTHHAAIQLWEGGTAVALGSVPYTGQPRRLAGRCTGGLDGGEEKLQLILDGTQMVEANDTTGLGPGASGVFVAKAGAAGLTARFARFEVRALPGGPARQAPPPKFDGLAPTGYTDDFAGTTGGFGNLVVKDAQGGFLAQYENGTYHLRADGFIQRSAPADPVPDHAVAEVTATKISRGPTRYGLTWAQDEDRYYEVAIDDDGFASIGYVDGDRAGYVELASTKGVTAIKKDKAPNRIHTEFDRTSGSVVVTLSVNDVPVLRATDIDRWKVLHFSQIVIRSTKQSTELTDVRFDDYRLAAM